MLAWLAVSVLSLLTIKIYSFSVLQCFLGFAVLLSSWTTQKFKYFKVQCFLFSKSINRINIFTFLSANFLQNYSQNCPKSLLPNCFTLNLPVQNLYNVLQQTRLLLYLKKRMAVGLPGRSWRNDPQLHSDAAVCLAFTLRVCVCASILWEQWFGRKHEWL